MPKRKRIVNCVVLSCLHKPGVIWRFFRRAYFFRLTKEIERLPSVAKKLGKEPGPPRGPVL